MRAGRLANGFAAAGIACAAPLLFLDTVTIQRNYDLRETQTKLARIGRCLALYREEYKPLPVDRRKTYSDAGLPPTLLVFIQAKGRKWSLPGGMEAFRISAPFGLYDIKDNPNATHFSRLYWTPEHYERLGDISSFFSSRGDELPILADFSINTDAEFADHSRKTLRAVVLRLNGKVDVVEFKHNEHLDILRK